MRPSNKELPVNRKGFTLIELIAVMGIIVALALVVAGGYSGIARSIAEGQASRQVRDGLLLARQTACVNGSRVYLYILNEDEFVICRKIGISSGKLETASYNSGDPKFRKNSKVFPDYFTDLSSFVNEIDLNAERSGYNASSGFKDSDLSSSSYIFDLGEPGEEKPSIGFGILRGVEMNEDLGFGWNVYIDESIESKYFKENHEYGISLFPVRSLPKGFVFVDDPGTFVFFEPTGVAGPGKGKLEIKVAEAALQNDPKHQRKVTVSHSGKIEVEEPK